MKTIHFLVIWAAVLVLSPFAMSQGRQITEAKFYDGLHSGLDATKRVYPRRETDVKETLEKGKFEETGRIVSEYYSANNMHVVTTDTDLGKSSTSEMIQIGNDYYCREGSGIWKKHKQFCGAISKTAFPKAETARFTFEQSKQGGSDILFFWQYSISKPLENTGNYPIVYFFEDKVWLNSDRTMRRRELNDGDEISKKATSKTTFTFDYAITLRKIEAPIK